MKTLLPVLGLIVLLWATIACADEQAVSQPVGKYFCVLGEVNGPGDFKYTQGMTVKTAIQLAKGLSPRADKHRGFVVRENLDKVPFDPQNVLDGKSPDIPLEPGDTVVVLPGTVKVFGKVRNPGSYDCQVDMTVEQAIKAAGGFLAGADREAVYVEREGKAISVDLSKPEESVALAFKLRAGDAVQIPERTVTITGEVKNPGQYTLVPGEKDRLQDLVRMAGGTTPQANLRKVKVQSIQDGRRPTETYDLTSIETSQNPILRRGDAIFIPTTQPKKGIGLGEIHQAVLIIYLLSQIFR